MAKQYLIRSRSFADRKFYFGKKVQAFLHCYLKMKQISYFLLLFKRIIQQGEVCAFPQA